MEQIIPTPTQIPDFKGAPSQWLRVQPGTPDMADLFDLNDDDFAVKCIRFVLEQRPFDLPLSVQHLAAGERFSHFFFESRNLEKVFGTKNLAIGYPMVYAQVQNLSICAPLFLWQIQLEPHASNPDQWIVQRTDQHTILPNYPLFHLIDTIYNTDFSERTRNLTETRQLNTRNLSELADGVRLLLRLEEEGLPFSVQPLPTADEAEYAQAVGRLSWSSVVGIFPTLPKITRTDAPVVIPDLPADDDWQHALTLLPLDPSQRSVLHAIQRSAINVVEGASGTGKTYLISATIINALANGKKCLVVSKSISALRRAQKFIVEKGFGDLSFILRDLTGDHLMLADMLRAAANTQPKHKSDVKLLNTVMQQTLREQQKLDEAWKTLKSDTFDGLNFSDAVGRFLRANRIEGKDLLLSQINPADFEFTEKEYQQITEAIRASEPIFARFPTLQHPLSRLQGDIFTQKVTDEGFEWTVTSVNGLLEKATQLHHEYITKTNDYAETLADHYEQHHDHLLRLNRRVREALADGTQRFGADFGKPLSTTDKLAGTLSDRYKLIVAGKAEVGKAFEDLRKAYAMVRYFEFDFPTEFDTRDIPRISKLSEGFENALSNWHKKIPSIVREDVRRLNARTIHSAVDFRDSVKELEQHLDDFVSHFNASKLYAAPLRHEMLTIPKRQEFLEEMIHQLEETQFSLRDYNDFSVWQRHWLSLSASEQKVVRALCNVKPRDWVAAFESWYLHHFLQTRYNADLRWTDDNLQAFARGFNDLKNLLPEYLGMYWQQRKEAALKKMRSSDSKAYKTWFGKDNRTLSANEDIADLVKNHIDPLTETLPVLLVSPHVANDVVRHSNMLFDVVIVDEAHNISKQQCYTLFDQAKHLVVFGDSKQDMTPAAEDDFLEFCKTLGAPSHVLDYQHQDCPEEWIEFNRVAFDTPFRRLPSGRAAQDVTVVANVEGRYDEAAHTNEAEARQIIDWLHLVEQTPAKTYPVVGIACATVQQRDLIATQLLRVRQRRAPGHEKIQQLQLNGLGVYQFSELQGQHVDIMMISLVHGITDTSGTLTRDFHFWNSQEGLNQLHVTLTRATQKVFIAHSIPPGLYAVLAADRTHRGTSILSHLVTFGELTQSGDHAAATAQIEKMKRLLGYQDRVFEPSVFMQEVELALTPFFEPGSVRRNVNIAGVTVPIVIKTEDKTVIPLFDGVFSNTETPSYEWEEKVKQFFNRQHVQYIPVLSAQWWKAPRQEARRFAALVANAG
jgi:hypothetical protein